VKLALLVNKDPVCLKRLEGFCLVPEHKSELMFTQKNGMRLPHNMYQRFVLAKTDCPNDNTKSATLDNWLSIEGFVAVLRLIA
jgi:hypothetical protein